MSDTHTEHAPAVGVILAGGAGSRLGGTDKGLAELNGKPLIEYVLTRLAPQVDQILIVANRHQHNYAKYQHPVISDLTPGYEGPLSGMLSALQWITEHTPGARCVFVPVDAPLLPLNLSSCLLASAGNNQIAVARNTEGLQPICCLIDSRCLPSLQQAFESGERSPSRWLQANNAAVADFPDSADCIWSINTPQELQSASKRLSSDSSKVA